MNPERCCRVALSLSILVVTPSLAAQDSAGTHVTASTFIVGAQETAAISVTCPRPVATGRAILGELVPFDKVWITGRSLATEVTCPRPFMLGSLTVPAGTYSLWTLPVRLQQTKPAKP